MPAKRVYLSGIQALVELPMLQRARDEAAKLNTAGFISGYRGSPLGSYDQQLWRAKKRLAEARVTFEPGVNEDLAATAVWGSQQTNLFHGARYDGVFGLWYGKGPGADRSMDVFKHANAAGTSRHGGVLLVAGDDHGAKSSTLPHQSDHILAAAMIPVLNPANVQEFLDFGLHGWAMSRYSGCWVGLKAIADTVETSSGVLLDPDRIQTLIPEHFMIPPGGLNIRWPDQPLEQELRLQRFKVYAAMAYAHHNQLNRIVMDSPKARLGIITTGKSYLDVLQALDGLGIDEAGAAAIGIRLFKIGMPWPLDAVGVRHFAEGLEEVLVVEEKRQVIEYQLKEQLYNWREDVRPRVIGKYDETGEWDGPSGFPGGDWLLPAAGELTPAMIARVIAARIARFHTSERIQDRLAFIAAKEQALAHKGTGMLRVPHFCSGCPHNTSTKVPDGSRALAGIGCHYMALWMDPEHTQTFSQMGGEGVAWVGQAPFTDTKHVFANLGDGTFAHSGLLAIRQAVAARVNITYKILFNDAVAMTGGQSVEGTLTVPLVVDQVRAEGVGRVVVVTDEPEKYVEGVLPDGVAVHHRRELDRIQRELRDIAGTTVLVYDQTCAAEKRRRRKRGTYPDPAKRMVINERVCEGCGDCSAKSNCMSVVPIETEFGRKRAIDQSSCNKDFSCVEGFCPSFVTVLGGKPRRGRAQEAAFDLPEPKPAALDRPYGILVTGVGGTGIVTIGALLGTAATLEGKGVSVLDMAGLAQKGGPVWSHIRVARDQEQLHAARIAAGEADLVLGCDLVVTVADDTLAKMRAGFTKAVVNTDFSVTSDFVRGFAAQARSGDVAHVRDPNFPAAAMLEQLDEAVGATGLDLVDATRLATALLGDSIATNLFMVGFAYQRGLLPLRAASIAQAIEMNGAAVAMNQAAFQWGRRAALDPAAVHQAARPEGEGETPSADLDEVIERRATDLTAYQNAILARRYQSLVAKVREAEARATPGRTELAEAVARYLYKLMAVKDEYEVARLYTGTGFVDRIASQFEGDVRLEFNLAPPLLSRARKGAEPRKMVFGPWVLGVFRVLTRLRFLRGTPFNLFGYSHERRTDRRLLRDYRKLLKRFTKELTADNHAVAVELAALPEGVRGYGPVRARHVAHYLTRRAELMALWEERKVGLRPNPPRAGRPLEPVGLEEHRS